MDETRSGPRIIYRISAIEELDSALIMMTVIKDRVIIIMRWTLILVTYRWVSMEPAKLVVHSIAA